MEPLAAFLPGRPIEMVIVYVLRGTAGKRYVGITNDLERRIARHKRGGTKAGHLLGDFELIHTEQFQDNAEARA